MFFSNCLVRSLDFLLDNLNMPFTNALTTLKSEIIQCSKMYHFHPILFSFFKFIFEKEIESELENKPKMAEKLLLTIIVMNF